MQYYMKRANVVLEVEEDSVPYYISQGYSVLDDNGNVVVQAIPTDIGELRKFYVEASARIEALEKRIEELESLSVTDAEPKKRGRKPKLEE